MNQRKLDVSTGAGGSVAVRRTRFDNHLNDCERCAATGLCSTAQTIWRAVCLAALRARQKSERQAGA